MTDLASGETGSRRSRSSGVTPVLGFAMLRLGRTPSARRTVGALETLWLVAGRSVLYLTLAGRTVRDCLPG